MTCDECHGRVEEDWMVRYNEHVFCSPVCLEEWYENKRQERRRR